MGRKGRLHRPARSGPSQANGFRSGPRRRRLQVTWREKELSKARSTYVNGPIARLRKALSRRISRMSMHRPDLALELRPGGRESAGHKAAGLSSGEKSAQARSGRRARGSVAQPACRSPARLLFFFFFCPGIARIEHRSRKAGLERQRTPRIRQSDPAPAPRFSPTSVACGWGRRNWHSAARPGGHSHRFSGSPIAKRGWLSRRQDHHSLVSRRFRKGWGIGVVRGRLSQKSNPYAGHEPESGSKDFRAADCSAPAAFSPAPCRGSPWSGQSLRRFEVRGQRGRGRGLRPGPGQAGGGGRRAESGSFRARRS